MHLSSRAALKWVLDAWTGARQCFEINGELKILSVSLFRHHLDVIASVNVIVIHKNEAMKPIEIL